MKKINQTDTAVVISGVTKSTVGSGRKIQRTPSITSWNREIKIPKGVNPDSGPVWIPDAFRDYSNLVPPIYSFELTYWECKLIENYLKVAILFAGNILTVQGNYLHWRQPNDENEFIFSNQSHLIFMIIYCTLKREAVHMWPIRICTCSNVPCPAATQIL